MAPFKKQNEIAREGRTHFTPCFVRHGSVTCHSPLLIGGFMNKEQRKEYMRKWAKAHKGYFNKKHRERYNREFKENNFGARRKMIAKRGVE